ncbi:heavy-metal-associated domain-containing protein [bacterium]|nr:heavy-metal-associated domain-containing protein [bacterium]
MKKIVTIQNLDCANCAAKLERAIAKIDGVKAVSLSFMAQKLVLDIDESNYTSIVENIINIARKIEPDCKIIGF